MLESIPSVFVNCVVYVAIRNTPPFASSCRSTHLPWGSMGKNVWEARFLAFSTSRGTKNLLERYIFQIESELQGSPAADHPIHPGRKRRCLRRMPHSRRERPGTQITATAACVGDLLLAEGHLFFPEHEKLSPIS